MKNKTKVLLTSMLTIAMTASLAVGGTYALFTSEDSVNIAVTSGKVNVTATIKSVTLYSMDVATNSMTFENGGTATLDTKGENLTLTNVTPGDKAVVELDFTNNSNVAIQYRIGTTIAGDLEDALVVTKNGTTLAMGYDLWEDLGAGASLDAEDATIAIELPVDYEDQVDGTTNISFFIEAVQGNAPVANVNMDGKTTTESNLEDANGNTAKAPAGVKMKDGATTMTLNVEEKDSSSANTSNFTLGDGATTYAFDVVIPEVAADNDTAITVTMDAPANLTNVMMFHKGVIMVPVASAAEVNEHNEYYYDIAGSITLATKNFSNFTVAANVDLKGVVYVSNEAELLAAVYDNAEAKEIIFTNDITLNASKSNGYGATGILVDGETINGNGYTFTVRKANGTWDSSIGMKAGTVKNLTVAGAMRGIFMPGATGDVYIENVVFYNVIYTFNSDAGSKDYSVTLKDCTVNGWTSFSAVHKSVTFENCTFGKGSGYAFSRPYMETTYIGCDFAEGFKIDARAMLTFDGCTYAGNTLTADNIGSLVGNVANTTIK